MDERGTYNKGDFMVNPPGSQHLGLHSPVGCICLLIWQAPVCFLDKASAHSHK